MNYGETNTDPNLYRLVTRRVTRKVLATFPSELRDFQQKLGPIEPNFLNRKSYRGEMHGLTKNEMTNFINKICRSSGYHPLPFAGNIESYIIFTLDEDSFRAFRVNGKSVSIRSAALKSRFENEVIRADIHGKGGSYIFLALLKNALTTKYLKQGELLTFVDIGCFLEGVSLLAAWMQLVGCIHFFVKNTDEIKIDGKVVVPICFYRLGHRKA